MPETDILNEKPIWEESLQDSMCPNYGLARKRTSTLLHKKAIGGVPWSRGGGNTGHSFALSWIGRSWACVQRLKRYYEQYEDGFFTIIDHDGGGRHYVGRFTSEVSPTQTGNGTFDVQNVTFEEIPCVPMVKYPDDWDNDAITFSPKNDFGEQKLATSGTWVSTVHSFSDALPLSTMDNAGTAGHWAQYEYRGYGFKLYLLQGPAYGQCQVFLDGVLLQAVDCYAADDIGAQPVVVMQDVSLDIHRVKVVVQGLKNSSASALTIGWHSLEVMR